MSGSGTRNPNLGVVASQVGDISEPWRRNLGRTKMLLSLPRPAHWWTGLAPQDCPGFDKATGTLHSLDMLDLSICSRQQVLDYFNNTWTLNELLFSGLIGEEPFFRPPYHALRHPLIFYYVHPSVLYVSKLRLAGLLEGAINSYFENIFETGVDEMSWDDMSKNEIEWPSIDDAQDYRRIVYKKVVQLIESHPDLQDNHPPLLQSHPLWALFMGMEHERIHIETSSVLMRELPVHLVSQPPEWPALAISKAGSESGQVDIRGRGESLPVMLEVGATSVKLGKSVDYPTYGWDNEYGQREVDVASFATSEALISNAQFWRFVESGGYRNKEFWSDIGWRWRSFRNVKWPTFWVPDGPAGSHQFRLRTIFEIVPMQWSWPAVVNYHEAKAYCRWLSMRSQKGSDKHPHPADYRLISEAEHAALRKHDPLARGDSRLPMRFYNTNLRQGGESDVEALNQFGGRFGDVFGNVWQWGEDHFNALDGFELHPFYDDFSLPCFDSEHQMIFGGSFISTGDESSEFARFHFRPHFFQHAGFRVVQAATTKSIYLLGDKAEQTIARKGTGQTADLSQIINLHYEFLPCPVESLASLSNFPGRLTQLVGDCCARLGLEPRSAKLLEIGCTVGGNTLNFAEKFGQVIGVDIDKQFIDIANIRKDSGAAGDTTSVSASTVSASSRLHYELAGKLEDSSTIGRLADFDVVMITNCVPRAIDFGGLIRGLSSGDFKGKKDGLFVLVAPQDLPPFDFSEALELLTASHFELLEEHDLPLILREDERQWKISLNRVAVLRIG
jgi:5-histidylcysteine sulfoxide synthase